MNFPDRHLQLRHVPQAISGRDDVEAPRAERQRQHVTHQEARMNKTRSGIIGSRPGVGR